MALANGSSFRCFIPFFNSVGFLEERKMKWKFRLFLFIFHYYLFIFSLNVNLWRKLIFFWTSAVTLERNTRVHIRRERVLLFLSSLLLAQFDQKIWISLFILWDPSFLWNFKLNLCRDNKILAVLHSKRLEALNALGLKLKH